MDLEIPVVYNPDCEKDMLDLPYSSLEELEYLGEVTEGPRFSSSVRRPEAFFGPVTIRNYLAGFLMRSIRLTVPKTTPRYSTVFIHLPPEIQLMVLEYVHPIDLYHLSIASKYLRRLVMCRKAMPIWKAAFQRYQAHLPQCPPTVTEPQWTFMLFGPGICVGCGKYGALTDFAFLKQYCGVCMKTNYAYSYMLKDLNNRTVQPDHIVFSLIPRTYRYHGLRYTTSYADPANARYLRKDFQEMMRKVTLIQILIDHKVPRLAGLFDEYKVGLSSHLRRMEKASNTANRWACKVFQCCSSDYDKAFEQVTETCKHRLVNRGHEVIDVDLMQYSIARTIRVHNVHRLNSKEFAVFRWLRPELEAHIMNQKAARLREHEREPGLKPEIYDMAFV